MAQGFAQQDTAAVCAVLEKLAGADGARSRSATSSQLG